MKSLLRIMAIAPLFLFLVFSMTQPVRAASGWYGPGYDKIRDLPVAPLDTGSWFEVQGPGLNYNFSRANPESMAVYVRAYLQGKVTRAAVLDSTLSGSSAPGTDTLRYLADTNHCEFYLVAGFSVTSNSNALTWGHAPAGCRPSHTITFPATVTDAGNGPRQSRATLATTGIFTVYNDTGSGGQSATGFTTSGTKGVIMSGSFPKY